MASIPGGSTEEKEVLLSPGNSVDAPPSVAPNGDTSTQVSETSATARISRQEEATNTYRYSEPVVHYNSLSVDCRFPEGENAVAGSVQIIERDLGEENDFWNIHVDFLWKPRGYSKLSTDLSASSEHPQPLRVSVDEFLTLRLRLDSNPASLAIHLRGGKLFGEFLFPNGPDAAMAFLTALQTHVNTLVLKDEVIAGDLFAVEKKNRMRRVAPALTSLSNEPNRLGEDFSGLLDDLTLRAPASSSQRGRERQHSNRQKTRATVTDSNDLGMIILSQFAKVTQVAREVGEDISTFLDEKKRSAEADRKERERAARRRALDIYADIVASTDVERELPPRLCLDEKRGVPVSADVWKKSFDDSGMLKDPAVMRQAIFAGGVEQSARHSVWPFILGFYPWGSSQIERNQIATQKQSDYTALKEKWTSLQSSATAEDSISMANNPDAIMMDRRKRVSKAHADYIETEEQIAKDIVRTDRHLDLYMQDDAPATLVMGTLLNVYATYDNRIRYCQGMSDFLSPILHVLGVDDESLVFWCFESLMCRIEGNFRIDQSGMRSQLSKLRSLVEIADEELADFFEHSDPDYYCCFRWILVRFKRELPFASTARLWEVLWTRQVGGDDLHIFIAAALLIAHRRQLLSLPEGAFDSLLRYVNDMSMRIDVDFALREGELCFRKFGPLIQSDE